MKIVTTSVFSTLLFFTAATAWAASTPTTVPVSMQKLFVPNGFDSNDNVQIVGAGLYANSCYRNAETKVRVDHEKKTVFVLALAYHYDGYCLQVVLPFDRVIDVGILQEGTYSIVQELDGKTLGQITLRKATGDGPDDFMYAPISQAFFQSRGLDNRVFLAGEFPLSCMRLKEVRVHAQTDVLVIQPIVEIDSSRPCVDGRYPFENMTDVGFLPSGRYLLHVRSMNAKSINTLFEVP